MRAVVLLACVAMGCSGDDGARRDRGKDKDGSVVTTPDGMLETRRYGDVTDPGGYFEVEVQVDEGVTAFQITGDSEKWVSLEELYDPDGDRVLYWEDWWTSSRSLTDAFFGNTKVTAFDWPVRDSDGELKPGTWRAVWSVLDNQGYYAGGEPVEVTVDTKRDDDFGDAVVRVQIAYADGVDDDPAVVAAIEQAVERWREVWGAYGLQLQEHYVSTDLDPTLQWTYSGDASVQQVAGSKGDGALQLVVGEKIRNENFTYGISAGIPGTIGVTTRSYVVLSWLVHAGRDAAFDDDEIRLMGETMAHECGHYAGLYHPVESDYRYWDALDDTTECRDAGACESELGDNLMFPYSICDGSGCVATDQLTAGQAGVMQRYLGAL